MTGMRPCTVLAMVLVGVALAGVADAWEVRLRAAVTTQASLVRLGDVAEVSGADRPTDVSLEQIVVALGPTRSHSRELTTSDIRRALALRNVELQHCQFTGASRSVLSYGVAAPAPGSNPVRGEGAARARQPGHARVPVEAPAQQLIPAIVAVRPLTRGEMVQEADVELRQVEKAGAPSGLIQRLADAVGRQTRQSVGADQPLTVRALQQPLLVRKNEEVTVVVRCGAIQARRRAIALNDGTRGDMITVETSDGSSAQFMARVVDIQQVEVLPDSTSAGR